MSLHHKLRFRTHRLTSSVMVCILAFASIVLSCAARKNRPLIIYINSYHNGYTPSDQTMAGLMTRLDTVENDFKVFFLDGKRLSPEKQDSVANQTSEMLLKMKPDILIISDDHAIEKVLLPHIDKIKIPVVYCGVNWSAQKYRLPTNVTGMLEVLPIEKTVNTLQSYVKNEIKSITVLSEKSNVEEKNKEYIVPLIEGLGMKVNYIMVSGFADWKKEFIEAQTNSDALFLPTNGAIKNWNHDEAVTFVSKNIKVPVFTCDDFMIAYSAVGFTKVASEQGEWAGEQAMKILQGAEPHTILVAKNEKSQCWVNQSLCVILDLNLSKDVGNSCYIYKKQ